MGLGSTPSRGAWPGCGPPPSHQGRASGHAPQVIPSLVAGRVPVGGSGPSGLASGQEAVCRKPQHCPRLRAHPQMCSCGSTLTPPVLGAPGQRHPTARMEKSGPTGAGRAPPPPRCRLGWGWWGGGFISPKGYFPFFILERNLATFSYCQHLEPGEAVLLTGLILAGFYEIAAHRAPPLGVLSVYLR